MQPNEKRPTLEVVVMVVEINGANKQDAFMSDLSWREAIIQVLQKSTEPKHYADIAEEIAELGLRTDLGATPAATVSAQISLSLKNDGDDSPFQRVTRAYYSLRSTPEFSREESAPAIEVPGIPSEEKDQTGLINAFGMYWSRAKVLWTVKPRILGQQQAGSTPVDFCEQRGIYLLHDGRSVVYVGRTTDQALGSRLRQHIVDRLNGRWDRFSWFGVFPVAESGGIDTNAAGAYTIDTLIVTMEALMIEGLEPPQNRKRGDDFRAAEFLQVEDPEIQKTQILELMDELKKKL